MRSSGEGAVQPTEVTPLYGDWRAMVDVSILIVTRDRAQDLERCLESVFAQSGVRFEVIVVDNASSDSGVTSTLAHFPAVRILRLPKNYGDWEARDIGRLQCSAPFILSLDDDAELTPGALEELLAVARTNPRLAVVQPRVLEPRRMPGRVLGAHHDPAIPHLIAGFLGGACLLQASALQRAGGFPHFWLGGAEPFLSLRFLDLGYEMAYWPHATIVHWASPVGRVRWQRLYYGSAGRIRAVLRNEPRFFYRVAHVLWKPVVCALVSIQRGHFFGAWLSLMLLYGLGVTELFRAPLSKVATMKKQTYIRKNVVMLPDTANQGLGVGCTSE
ncbi:MAG: glycosyltransferase family 2 protein [Thermogutta sp.]